jgi:hypothetical protein
METFKKLLITILFIFTSCATQKDVIINQQFNEIVNENNNINNYREYKEQEIKYYQYVLKNNGEKFDIHTDTPKKEEKKPQSIIDDTPLKKEEEPKDNYKQEAINHKKELIQTLESKGLKPCNFVEKVLKKGVCPDTLDKSTEIKKDPVVEESNPRKGLLKNKDKEYRRWFWQGVFKIISSIYFIFLAITNFQLFTMIFPTSICLLACICYPIWWKRGYLDTPYAKIATFIAAYGGLFANILWIILYI